MIPGGFFSSQQWVNVKNNNGGDAPAFSVLRTTAFTVGSADDTMYHTVDQPNSFGNTGSCLIAGPVPIVAGAYGRASAGPIVLALYDDSDGTPAYGDIWGPRNGTWKLKKNTGGYFCLGAPTNTDQHLALFKPMPMTRFLGKADANIAKGSTGTISIYDYGTFGSESDTGENMSNVLTRFGSVTSGKWVKCVTRDGANWEVDATEC